MDIFLDTSSWQSLLVQSLVLTYMLVAGGWVLAKAGRSPLWVLFLVIPHIAVIAIWAFAYARWPFLQDRREDRRQDADG